MGDEEGQNDPRIEFLQQYTLKTMKLKNDKWLKMMSQEENLVLVNEFMERGDRHIMVIYANASGQLVPMNTFPTTTKAKAVYFIKRSSESVKKENYKTLLMFGDVSHIPLDQLSFLVESVFIPLISNGSNNISWPRVVTSDVIHHTGGLKGDVFILSGQVKGRTLLPLPAEAELIMEAAERRANGQPFDKNLIHTMETVVIEWSHQIQGVLKKSSAQLLLDGKNPGPLVEVDFWKARLSDLESITEQLITDKAQKMTEILEKTQSAYFPALKSMINDVQYSLEESADIYIHLKPMRRHFEEIEEADFVDLRDKLKLMFHCLCLVWSHCKHYQQPSRLVVLLQEITNLLLDLLKVYVSEEIIKMEPDEGIEKINDALQMSEYYVECYHTHRSNLETYFRDDPVIGWNFHTNLVFGRLEKFVQQLHSIKDYFLVVVEFLKLEKIEFAGLRGKNLSDIVLEIFTTFQDSMNAFSGKSFDPLDPNDKEFAKEYAAFMQMINEMDKRLGLIVCQAFDECSNCESVYKLIDMMGTLLHRPLVHENFKIKYPLLVKMVNEELDVIKKLYNHQISLSQTANGIHVHKNMPKVAGTLRWSQELKERTKLTVDKLRSLDQEVTETPMSTTVFSKCDEMLVLIKNFEVEVFHEWSEGVDTIAKSNLEKPLLVKETKNDLDLIHVNFDPKLVALLREVKYLNQLDECQAIPDSAVNVFSSDDTYHKFLQNLNVVVASYNNVKETVLDVEEPLIEERMNAIDAQLDKGITQLNWTSEAAWEYIEMTRDMVRDLEKKVQLAKANVEEMIKIMNKWSERPLYQRKDDKKDCLLNLDERANTRQARYNVIKAGAEKIHQLVQENMTYLEGQEDNENWHRYIEYIDDIILDGLFNCINCSLQYIIDNTDKDKAGMPPLLEAKLELQAPEMVFNPSLDQEATNSFMSLIEDILGDMFNVASLVPRVAKHKEVDNYQSEVEELAELLDLKEEILNRVTIATDKAVEFRNSFESYAYLWVDDRQEFMSQFLVYGHMLTAEEIEQAGEEGVPESPPTLTMFKEQVDSYEKVYIEVEKFQDTVLFDLWFRVDNKPFKSALRNIVKRWSLMFKQHLIDHVTNSLNDLDAFIKITQSGLNVTVEEGDYDGLVGVMAHLLAIKDRLPTTDNMFEPIKQTIELLKTYSQEMSDDIHQLLEELPEKWNTVKKQSVSMKQTIAPLQANEVNLLRRKLATFDVKQHEFRENFRKTAPFNYSSDVVYARIDRANNNIMKMESEMISLREAAGLFEVNVPDFKQLKACRREIILLKTLWDVIILVQTSFSDWNTTLWSDINVEQMEMDCKKFVKDIRTLDKEMRAWDAFTGLDSTVKNMVTSLRAVGELQNPAIRDRHWEQLMQATQVKFYMSDETNLADLLALNLHNFEDEVRNIVDKATKELSMEKTLKELDKTWKEMEFEHEVHNRTKLPLLKTSEELVETLEDNQVQLQNMMTSKFVGYFLEQVSSWQKKLSNADAVINIWMEVQLTWSHLESIFIGSEDIRAQLPEHSKQFDTIDADFKNLVIEAEKTPNVVQATNRPGLYDELEQIQTRLAVCEKALAEYLETKRLAFPRFYFISSADLLDILSKGNQPVLVARHLAKLFDSMAKLKFEDDTGRVALGMYSKDGEYVDFDSPCELTGQVEDWLNKLLSKMQATVRYQFTEAVVTYEEKPREQWLFEYPAQVALATTQVWWTTEVGIAFARLEEGYENALKDYYKKQITQLNTLINLLLGDLSSGDRQKIMTICTIDVHARDVVAKLIAQKVENSQAFTWLCQLRHRWDENSKHCFANICDAQFKYSYEYLGNTARLVITPLTDRCYITLTQSLHLTMSGAPAGPAGTGKTETTKDLGRALGMMVYVFNCSEQMDYKSIGNIYKGLSQTGAWGCFDEFNRISVEVLSVVAVQVKTIQDAIKMKKERFLFEGTEIKLTPTVGLFITMNPGYAGRTELPENLKTLFRPCAMVVPDFELIAEIMLIAEGFLNGRILARKFLTLYTLCKELLSKQDHYDWGLRAIKSVLVVAGSLKRSDRGRPEDQVLMRALRDFNTPKIVTDDVQIFMGLIGDLFPALDVPRKRDLEFEEIVKKSILDLGLQPEDSFVLKVVQLEELRHVRHSIFVIGGAGTGKSKILRSLNRTYYNMKLKPVWQDINPKAVTTSELYGFINQATREWKDGLFSIIMRDMSNMASDSPKWIVLDGDIDPMWIESLNTVMDDNKVLTLASNERVPLTKSMRLMFEIGHLKAATPATVSRAGILFVNASDLGWNPYVQSWIDTREVQSEKANLTILFEKYIPSCLDNLRYRFKKITPVSEISHIQTLCYLLETLLTPENTPPDSHKDLYELYFVFAAVWAFGGAMFQDQLVDYRVEFSKWWVTEFKTVKFPSQGTIFDYFLDNESKKWLPWSEKIPKFEYDPEMPLQSVLVHTSETTRYRYFIDLLMANKRPVMLVGNAGCGKTVLINDKLSSLDEETLVTMIPFNFYTTSLMLQQVMEKPLEKKAGRNFGPPGTKKLIYFIDDMNMPVVDTYGTVQPHTLIRQHLDYSHWFDRTKLTLKEVHNVQYVACMNPTAGSFTINPRLQRHFSVFAVSFPGVDALKTIYQAILQGHITSGGFNTQIQRNFEKIVSAALALHTKVTTTFLPTAIKFHYIFNLRDLSNIFQGISFAFSDCLKTPVDFVRLWLHEASRVYGDKLIEQKDMDNFQKMKFEIAKQFFEDLDDAAVKAEPLIFCHFANGIGEPKYNSVPSWESLNKILEEALDSYNEINAAMNLVLFEDAMHHVCRINRILESPRGNALLVGVGGSGKQSLTRLAASVSALEVFQIQLRKGYSVADLRADLAQLYIKAGLKNIGTVFLLTDAQVPDEKFLVLINDLLASGEIPNIFADDELENVINGLRNEVKGAGIVDTKENIWKFFIDRVRRQLKVVLCFSPVGVTLRVRSRNFPAIVNCTSIDWFHEWPEEALISVSSRFLSDIELITPEVRVSVSKFMAFAHGSVNEMSKIYLANERRYNYTTPKSFLELIALYQNLLARKHGELIGNMERLEGGLEKLKSTAAQVDDLKEKLAAQEVELKQKNDDADALIERVGVEQEKVGKEKEIADSEEKKVAKINEEVTKKQRDCEQDLARAEPALKAAAEALNTLNKANLTELKSFGKPPPIVVQVVAAVMMLLSPSNKIPKDTSWNVGKNFMGKVDQFLESLINFDKENIQPANKSAVEPYLKNPEFDPDFVKSKSFAAAGK
jgi:dynein heavy chain